MSELSKLRTEVKIALVAGGVLLGLVAGWFLVVAPKRHDASALKQQIADTRDQISVAQGVKTPTAPPPIRVADLFKLSRAMPNTADIPGVILQLSSVAAETGVQFESITPHDPVSYAAAAGVLLLAAVAAGLIPALRAARVDPMTALRSE